MWRFPNIPSKLSSNEQSLTWKAGPSDTFKTKVRGDEWSVIIFMMVTGSITSNMIRVTQVHDWCSLTVYGRTDWGGGHGTAVLLRILLWWWLLLLLRSAVGRWRCCLSICSEFILWEEIVEKVDLVVRLRRAKLWSSLAIVFFYFWARMYHRFVCSMKGRKDIMNRNVNRHSLANEK